MTHATSRKRRYGYWWLISSPQLTMTQVFGGWKLAFLAYQSVGVIYGDIGTSPVSNLSFRTLYQQSDTLPSCRTLLFHLRHVSAACSITTKRSCHPNVVSDTLLPYFLTSLCILDIMEYTNKDSQYVISPDLFIYHLGSISSSTLVTLNEAQANK